MSLRSWLLCFVILGLAAQPILSYAQPPGGGPGDEPGGPPPDMPGGMPPGMAGDQPGGQRGSQFRGPRFMEGITTCKVLKVDLRSGMIYVDSRQAGVTSVTVSRDTQVFVQGKATLAELKVGDKIYVSGTPTVIIATSLDAQEPLAEENLTKAVRALAPQTNTGNATQPRAGQTQPQPAAQMGVAGEVISLDPLTILLADKKKTQILGADTATVTRMTTATLEAIKPESDLLAIGPVKDGKVAATAVYQGDTQAVMRSLRDLMGPRMFGGGQRPAQGTGQGPGGRGGRNGGGGQGQDR